MTKGIAEIRESVKSGNSYNAIRGLTEEIAQRIAMITPMSIVQRNPARDNEGVAIADHGHVGNGPGNAFLDPHEFAGLAVRETARLQFGSDDGVYKNGILKTELRSVQAAKEFAAWLDDSPLVHGYLLDITHNDKNLGFEKREPLLRMEDITNDTSIFYFTFTISVGEGLLV